MDGLFVDLACEDERVVAQIGIHLERAGENSANDVFDELRVVMRLVNDEELVGPLEQIVRFARHGVFDDFDEIFGTDDVGLRLGDADENAAPAALVVRRDGQHVERAPRVGLGEAGLDQLVHGVLAHHVLRAGQAVMPSASTPTTRRVPLSSACAMPTSVYVSSPRFPLTGVHRSKPNRARRRTSARIAR